MISKPGSPALLGMAVFCILMLTACSNGPSLHFVAVTPASATVYFSAAAGGGVKGARAGGNSTRNSAIVASPQDITNATCRSQQFTATAFFSDGSSMDETQSVTWTSSNTSVAGINSTGNAFGFGLGTSTIGATFNNTVMATPASLEVDQLNSITMNPPMATINSGGSQQFVADGNFTLANGSAAQQAIVGTQLTWMSSDTNAVTVDANGNATSTGNGTPGEQVTITATSCDGGIKGTAIVNIGTAAVTLNVTPLTTTISTGTTVVFTAVTHSDNTKVTGTITWQSLSPNIATIDANSGIALGVGASGATGVTVMATESGTNYTGTATLNVSAAAARYAYVGNLATQNISSYTVNVGSATPLTPLATSSSFSPGPRQVLLHPSGDFLYFIDDGCSLHSIFIDSTSGALTTTQQPVVATSTSSTCVGAIDPLGRFIYTLSAENNAIYGFSIRQPTAQTGKTGATVAALTGITGFAAPSAPGGHTDASLNFPDWILIDKTGSFLYVVNNTNNTGPGSISQYAINADGTLTALSPATVPAGNGTTNDPFYGSIDRNGNLFVANVGDAVGDPETISGYSIRATGQLTQLGADQPVPSSTTIVNVLTSPAANYMYVVDQGPGPNGQVLAFTYTTTASSFSLTAVGSPTGSVSTYTVTQSGASAGGLTATSPASVPAGISTQFVSFYNAVSGQ